MGKQSKKRHKASGVRSPASDLLQPADAGQPSPKAAESPRLLMPSVRDEIEESLSKIYESFFQEFNKRIPERKAHQDPLDARPPQRSILDKKVKEKLTDKVRTLTRAIGTEDVYNLFSCKTLQFIHRLLAAVKDEQDDHMALGLLEDSYEIMENAIEVVGGLIQVYGSEGSQVIMHTGKNEFYDYLQRDEVLKDLLEQGSLMEPQREQQIYELIEQSEEMFEEESEFQRKIAQQESIQKMSIDDLVMFINDPKPKAFSRFPYSPSSEGSKSPVREDFDEFDQEVQRFRERLEKCSPARRKIKPKISEDWVSRLSIYRSNS